MRRLEHWVVETFHLEWVAVAREHHVPTLACLEVVSAVWVLVQLDSYVTSVRYAEPLLVDIVEVVLVKLHRVNERPDRSNLGVVRRQHLVLGEDY